MGYAGVPVLYLGFLFGQVWCLYSAVGDTLDFIPCLGRAVEEAPRPVQIIGWEPESGKTSY